MYFNKYVLKAAIWTISAYKNDSDSFIKTLNVKISNKNTGIDNINSRKDIIDFRIDNIFLQNYNINSDINNNSLRIVN